MRKIQLVDLIITPTHTFEMEKTLVLVCAAGKSSRMEGQDKLLVQINGEPLLRKQVRKACELNADVLVAHSATGVKRFKCLDGLRAQHEIFGSSSEGLSGTLREAAQKAIGYDYLMVVLADLPKLSPIHMARMLKAPRDFPKSKIWRAIANDGRPGHPTLFSKSIFPYFASLSGDSGAKEILSQNKDFVANIKFSDDAPVVDIDTPQDLAKYTISL